MKSEKNPIADDAKEADITRLDREYAVMGPGLSPKKALNRMKAAIARDRKRRWTTSSPVDARRVARDVIA